MATKKKTKNKPRDNGKHPGGRPPKYHKGMVKKVREYLDRCTDEMQEEPVRFNEQRMPIAWNSVLKVNIPTVEGLSLVLNIHKDTINEWDKEYPEFSVVIAELRAKQGHMLIANGLSGRYNPTIAKVLLSKHGYREATEVESDTKVTHKIDITEMLKKAYSEPDGTDND